MTDEWIKKMWYIYIYIYVHTMEYFSSTKRNKEVSFVETWMDLESVILSEVSQKHKYRVFMNTCGIYKNGTDKLISKAGIETWM